MKISRNLRVFWCAAAVLLHGVAASATAQTLEERLKSYVGRQLILRSYGNDKDIRLKKEDLIKPAPGCDVAVEIRSASRDSATVHFDLEHIGRPIVSGVTNSCTSLWPSMKLAIQGASTASGNELDSVAQNLLLTPEAYLALHRHSLAPAAAVQDEPVLNPRPDLTMPRPLLQVLATYSAEARRKRITGVVIVEAVIGSNGLIREPRIRKGLGEGLDEQTLRVLPLWRFEPARDGDKPVALRTNIDMTFRIH